MAGCFCGFSIYLGKSAWAAPQGPAGPSAPVLDKSLVAQTAAGPVNQDSAWFGWTMSSGPLGAIGDIRDDLAVAAIQYDDDVNFPPPNQALDAGAAFVYLNEILGAAPANPLTPWIPGTTWPRDDMGHHMDQLGNAIGDVRGTSTSPSTNLLFLGAPFRNNAYSCSSTAALQQGAVAVYDLNGSNPSIPTFLFPPKDPSDPCFAQNVLVMGHSLAVADVDGDNTKDLIVGAPQSDGSLGRVYIFFGRSDFLTTPITHASTGNTWLCLKPPTDATADERFGATVAGGDLDEDTKDELIVGAVQRRVASGRSYIIRGAKIQGWRQAIATGGPNVIPLTASDFQRFAPVDAVAGDAFGWQIGIAHMRGGDSKLDLAIYSERTEVNTSSGGCVGQCGNSTGKQLHGALFVYKNISSGTTGDLVDATPASTAHIDGYIKLVSPFPDPVNAPYARFGRSSAVVRWKYSDGSLKDCIVVGEPGAYNHGNCESGVAWLYELPLELDTSGNNPGPMLRLESPAIQSCSHFGAAIVALRYDTAVPGQQFAIAGREEMVDGKPQAGRVYTFKAPQ